MKVSDINAAPWFRWSNGHELTAHEKKRFRACLKATRPKGVDEGTGGIRARFEHIRSVIEEEKQRRGEDY